MKIKNLFIYFLTLSFILFNINYSCTKIFAQSQSKDYYPISYTKIYTEKENSNRIINGIPINITAK